jgi:hypothetical protein
MRLFSLLAITPLVALLHGAPAPDFQREIRPILSNKCFHCHGPDQDERKGGKEGSGGYRLDTEEGARAALDEGFGIVPGAPEKSAVIERVTTDDRDDVMPPRKMGKPLTAREVDLLTRWIASGAKYATHWSYVRPVRPKVPEFSDIAFQLPITWTNPIDAFLLQRLEREHLMPLPEADRATLLRRVTLDLTGLPPTLEEADTFLADTAPGAYERLVDRLLASPSYGEHWARMWLDLARYADSAGYADDPPRTIWAFRDYVINAFNRNLPFDQFTIEQIAGDLLPNPTEEQLIATAFHRNTMTNNEGGTQDEEFRSAAVVDRANTTMAVWMGTSFACAQCHTHKYDPITQHEYFRVFAFLNNTADADKKDEAPVLEFFTAGQKAQRARWEKELAALDGKFQAATATLAAGAEKWARAFPAQLDWRAPHDAQWKAGSGATMQVAADGAVFVPKTDVQQDTYTLALPIAATGRLTALRLESLPHESLPGQGVGHSSGGNFVITRLRAAVQPAHGWPGPVARVVRIDLPGKSKILQLAEVQVFSGGVNVAPKGVAKQTDSFGGALASRAIDGNTAGEWDKASVAHTTEGDNRYWEVDLGADYPIEKIVVWNRTELPERLAGYLVRALDAKRQPVWQQAGNPAPQPSASFAVNGPRDIAFAEVFSDFTQAGFDPKLILTDSAPKPAKGAPQPGWAVGGATTKPHALTVLAAQPVALPAGGTLTVTLEQRSRHDAATLGHFRLSTTDDARVAEHLRTPAPVLAALSVAEAERTAAQRATIGDHYVRTLAPELKGERQQSATLRKQIDGLAANTVPILRELPAAQRRKTHVHIRGNYLSPGDEVTEGTPAAFHPLPTDAPMNRLTFARWLVDEANPLTARVIANRYWEQLFGIGIVRTSEEFGAQGDLPEHPELLDWLATELVRLRWDMKAFVKLLVTSHAYRQSSKATPELLERDPDNRLLARGPRLRMSAEMVRDQALAVSGLLSRKMLGPSVRPPRPELGLKAAFGRLMDWETSQGEDRYRRALYTEARRTSPYPSMATFDAPSREVCTLRRDRTNTPLQALVTLNDPVHVEAAQSLARRMASASADAKEKASLGFRLCLTRLPTDAEIDRLVRMHAEALAHYQADAKAATDMATNPIGPIPAGADAADLAAWTTVANVLLNLDEMLMKR